MFKMRRLNLAKIHMVTKRIPKSMINNISLNLAKIHMVTKLKTGRACEH